MSQLAPLIMKALGLSTVVLSLVLLAAHFLRYGNTFGVLASLALIALLFLRRAWVARLIQAALVAGAIEWIFTIYERVQMRIGQGAPFGRMVMILGVVTVVTAGSALLFQTKAMKKRYRLDGGDRQQN